MATTEGRLEVLEREVKEARAKADNAADVAEEAEERADIVGEAADAQESRLSGLEARVRRLEGGSQTGQLEMGGGAF